jgi:hypothetical protein
MGAVFGRGDGEFYDSSDEPHLEKSLGDLYKIQPSLFVPRRNWPKPAIVFNSSADASQAYARTTPMFSSYNGVSWESHVKDMHTFLVTACKRKHHEAWLDQWSLIAMGRVIARGLEDVVTPLPQNFSVDSNDLDDVSALRQLGRHRGRLDPKARIVNFRYGVSLKPDSLHTQMGGSRFFFGFVFFTNHWGALAFDRKRKALYFFDSNKPTAADNFNLVVRGWRQMTYLLNLPYHFQAIMVPCTSQQNTYECGYASTMFLFQLFRSQVGLLAKELKFGKEQPGPYGLYYRTLGDKNRINDKLLEVFELRLRDWILYDPTNNNDTYGNALARTFRFLKEVAANELGITKGPQEDVKSPLRYEFNTTRVQEYVSLNGERIPIHQAHTPYGGLVPCDLPGRMKRHFGSRLFPVAPNAPNRTVLVEKYPHTSVKQERLERPVTNANMQQRLLNREEEALARFQELQAEDPVDQAISISGSDKTKETQKGRTPLPPVPGANKRPRPVSLSSNTSSSQARPTRAPKTLESSIQEISLENYNEKGLEYDGKTWPRAPRVSGVEAEYFEPQTARGIRQEARERLGHAGVVSTIDIAEILSPLVPMRNFLAKVPQTDNYVSLVPEGLVRRESWWGVGQAIEAEIVCPSKTVESRDQRAARRERSKSVVSMPPPLE